MYIVYVKTILGTHWHHRVDFPYGNRNPHESYWLVPGTWKE